MEKLHDDIDDLIGKFLAGEASPEESRQLDAWIKADEQNRVYFDHCKIIFERSGHVQDQQFDTDAAWNNLKKKLEKTGGLSVRFANRNNLLYWRIAASFLFIAMISYFIFRFHDPDKIEMYTIASTQDLFQDTLPDGTIAFLNKETSISYTYDPRGRIREVELKGEAYFNIKHEQDKPFILRSEEVTIEDIGTIFNVKAYPAQKVVEVFVEHGEVAFYTTGNPGLRLAEGETGIYDKTSQSFTKMTKSNSNVLAYKTKQFNFSNVDLGTVVASLNEVYDKKIKLEGDHLKTCKINVSFSGEAIDNIAAIIAETLSLTIEKNNEEIILKGAGCDP